jgi:bifunctional enzyme CysN/CysC
MSFVADPYLLTDLEDSSSETQKGLLHFITCGSVDDGKSSLIGRMLWDSKLIFDDQRSLLEAESKAGGRAGNGDIDFSLLVDGLSAEREQGITIDVAYRFFQTDKRKFIVADTPGHVQYTRNMATGASSADLAVILVDARNGMLSQTRRHATIVHLLGINHVVLAVNKMDLVSWREECFADIKNDFCDFADKLGIEHVVCVPVSAVTGANISERSQDMPWYQGPSLLEHLDHVDIDHRAAAEFRFPVQWVNRPDANFRGFCGTISSGSVAVGERVRVYPSLKEATVSRIVTFDGDLPMAISGKAVTLVLDQEIDISRGDVLCTAEDDSLEVTDQLQAQVVWVGEEALIPGRHYLIKTGTGSTGVKITNVKYKLDIETQTHVAAQTIELNDVGVVTLSLDRPMPFDSYAKNHVTGSFIIIDRYTNATIAAGMIEHGLRRAQNIVWHDMAIDKHVRAGLKSQKPACLWFTGLSGAGKSTIANMLDKRLTSENYHTYTLDGDNVRHGLNCDLGFTETDRVENIRRIGEVAKLMVDAGLIVLVCAISPYRNDREMVRQLFEDGEFQEVFVNTPLEECEARDPKGLYKKARQGEIPNFTGISAPYEPPRSPEIHLDGKESIEKLAETVFDTVEKISRTAS